MVVPRTFAEGMRQNMSSGNSSRGNGRGDTHYWNIHATDLQSFARLDNNPSNRSSLAKAIRQHFR